MDASEARWGALIDDANSRAPAAELGDRLSKKLRSAARFIRKLEGSPRTPESRDASGNSQRRDAAFTLQQKHPRTSIALGGVICGAGMFGLSRLLHPQGAFHKVISIVAGVVGGLYFCFYRYRLWLKEQAAEKARGIKDAFD